jgi:hypothetical protein
VPVPALTLELELKSEVDQLELQPEAKSASELAWEAE